MHERSTDAQTYQEDVMKQKIPQRNLIRHGGHLQIAKAQIQLTKKDTPTTKQVLL